MPTFTPLVIATLSFSIFLTTLAAPIPAPVLHDQVHSHDPPPPVQPKHVHIGNHPFSAQSVHPHGHPQQDHHYMGSAPAHLDEKGHMTQQNLKEHAQAIAADVGNDSQHNHPGYNIAVRHDPNDKIVHFVANQGPPQHGQPPHQAVLHPNTPDHTSQHQGIHNAINAAHNSNPHTAWYVNPSPGIHGEGVTGTWPVHPTMQHGMTPAQLQAHGQAVKNTIIPNSQSDATVHVAHTPGSDQVHYRATTAPGGSLLPQPSALEKQAIHDHLTNAIKTNDPFPSSKLNKNAPSPDKQTYSGLLPALDTRRNTPSEMAEYAKFAATKIAETHNLTPQQKDNLVVTAHHNPGEPHVLFHTPPRHADLYTAANLAKNTFPHIGQSMTERNVVFPDPNTGAKIPHAHAEIAGVMRYAKSVGANQDNFMEKMAGHVIGVAGKHEGDDVHQPCATCHVTLGTTTPANYKGRDRPLGGHEPGRVVP